MNKASGSSKITEEGEGDKKKQLLPQPSSYVPFLPSEEFVRDYNKRSSDPCTSSNSSKKKKEERDDSSSEGIKMKHDPSAKYIVVKTPVKTDEYVPEPVIVKPVQPSYVPGQIGLSKNQRRNKKRNLKRRGENRKIAINSRDTRDIPGDDSYWNSARARSVVPINAKYVDRTAKMEDGAIVLVRSHEDGTVVAIRDSIPVIITKPSED